MVVYLAGVLTDHLKNITVDYSNNYLLDSFYYLRKKKNVVIPNTNKFMLDSGAFTVIMQNHKAKDIDWEEYINDYANYINTNNIDLFFEVDIDEIIGLDGVLYLRKQIERKTGKKPIPVYHSNRSREQYINDCKNYPYVAFGYLGELGQFKINNFISCFNWFANTAHFYGAKCHALGLTNTNLLPLLNVDSVDSSTWTCGNRFGCVYIFNGKKIVAKRKTQKERKTTRIRTDMYWKLRNHNLNEWMKYQNYALRYL